MINEIADGFQDLLSLADRGLARVFNDPWPPATQDVSNRNRIVYSTSVPSVTRIGRAMPVPPVRSRRTETVTRTKVTTRKTVASSTTHKTHASTVVRSYAPQGPAPIVKPKSSQVAPPKDRKRSAPPRSPTIPRPSPVAVRLKPKPSPIPRITAEDIKVDVDRCDILVIAIAEMEICKEIFAGWSAQLDLAEPRKKDALEQKIVTEVQKINNHAHAALASSHSLMHSYRALIHFTEQRLGKISQSKAGGKLYTSAECEKMASTIALHSSTLVLHVKQIQERLRSLVSDIERTKEQARKRALRRRIWSWLVKTLRAISFLISAGGAIFALFHPLGLLDTGAITVASMLSGAIAKLCENTQKTYDETTFDEILVFMRDHVPESAKAAEIALTNFQACHRILQVELDIRQGKRMDWLSPGDAKRAHAEWKQVSTKLQNVVVPNQSQASKPVLL